MKAGQSITGDRRLRDDLLVLSVEDATWFLGTLRTLEQLAKRCRVALSPTVAARREVLLSYLAGRATGHADATTRPVAAMAVQDGEEVIDTDAAAKMLGITSGAMRKRCRSGRYMGVARKERGRWVISKVEVEVEMLESRSQL